MRRAILIAALCLLLGAQTAQAQERSLEDLDRIAPCERTVHRYSSWEELPDRPGMGNLIEVDWNMPEGLVECKAVYHFRNELLKSGKAHNVMCLPMDRMTVFCGSVTRLPAHLVLWGEAGSAISYDTETQWMFSRMNLYFPIVMEEENETGAESGPSDNEQ